VIYTIEQMSCFTFNQRIKNIKGIKESKHEVAAKMLKKEHR